MDGSVLTPDFHDHRAGQVVEQHAHEEGQVLIASEGSMHVWFGSTRLTLAPRAAVWVPPGIPHAARSLEHTAFRGVMVDGPRAAVLPRRVARIAAAPLLLGATLELTHASTVTRRRVSNLWFDELSSHLAAQTGPRPPRDLRFVALCNATLEDLAAAPSLDEAATQVRMSRRSFTRAFRAATGSAWTTWVREARLAQAATLLGEGARVTEAALAVGYATPSAFSFAFRRGVGRAPIRLRGR
jgi:AraC-like DNA-binding protein